MDMKRAGTIFLLIFLLVLPAAAPAAGELVRNSLFTEGKSGKAAEWRTASYAKDDAATEFGWQVDAAGIGVIEIHNRLPNDARWIQSIPVSPGTWYRLSGWIRTEQVGARHMGAYLTIMGTFHNSRDLRGSQAWQPVSLWVKTGALETKLEIGARLGGYSSENNGRAFFTALSLEELGFPAEGTPFVYGGRPGESEQDHPIWAELLGLLLVLGLALLIWRYVARPDGRVPR
ncbi:MAG: hypothetical protein VCC00_11095 [Deltaproteobacteria bacterium]